MTDPRPRTHPTPSSHPSRPQTVSRNHFAPRSPTEFLDLFTPVAASSASRARAFLWLCFHYHEAPAANPFADASCEGIPDRAPALVPLTPDQARAENVDTPEEAQRAADMAATRRRFRHAPPPAAKTADPRPNPNC